MHYIDVMYLLVLLPIWVSCAGIALASAYIVHVLGVTANNKTQHYNIRQQLK